MNRSTDPWLIAVVVLLIVFGLVMVYSASAVVAAEWSGDQMYFFTRQVVAGAFGLALCVATALTPTRLLRRYGLVIYGACLAMLVLCHVPGIQYKANGAARWIGIGPVHFQPSEFAKIAVLIVLADFLDRNRAHLGDLRVLARAALIPLPAMILIFPQPDFGTTAIMAGLCTAMLFVAGMRLSHMAVVAGLGCVVGIPLMLMEQYRMQRLTSFMDPWANLEDEGYHVIQGWIALHSGGMWGQGLGKSIAKLHFLPEPWTDFIAAVMGEELGLIGLIVLVSLYAAFVWRGLSISRRARDPFSMYLTACLTAGIGLQAFFNLAVVLGLVPPKGLVLPFISYGATALQAHLWCVGILLSVASEAGDRRLNEGWAGPPPRTPAAPAAPHKAQPSPGGA